MTDFLGRLASRAVSQPVPGRDRLIPTLPSQLGATGGLFGFHDAPGSRREEHAEVIATPSNSGEPDQPMPPRRYVVEAPRPERPAPERRPSDEAPRRREAADGKSGEQRVVEERPAPAPPPNLARQDPPEPEPASRPSVAPPIPTSGPTAERSAEIVGGVPSRPRSGPTAPTVDDSPVIEAVIELRRIPGPIVRVEREVPVAVPIVRPSAPESPDERGAPRNRPPTEIRFVPREPLAPLGLAPLRTAEILQAAAVRDAVSPNSVVHVHIGRIDVQRPMATPPPAPQPQRASVLSLDEYLEQRSPSGTSGSRR